ncbi:hypothetical protein BDQ17DRAFT_1364875 [Cyathus striatus]|nr:hypothetical protein BDQ17DRAFT_1364875 [Cyathus striatus]
MANPVLIPNRYDHAMSTHLSFTPMEQAVYRPVSMDSASLEKPPKDEVSLNMSQTEAQKKGVVWRALLIGGIIFLVLVAMIAVLLSYLCVAHQCARSSVNSRILLSTAPLGKTLTISQVSSHVAPLAVPLVMGLFSYQLAAQWLKASIHSGQNRPSPMQLGLILSICNGAGIMNLYNGVRYVFTGDKSRRNIHAPLILRQSVFFLFLILLLSYIISGADAWFHATSRAITLNFNTPFSSSSASSNLVNFGREINSTMCQIAATAVDPTGTTQQSCGLQNDGTAGSDMVTRQESLRALSNSSLVNRVEYTDDQTAIMVPTSLPSNITFAGTTIGVKSACKSITNGCLAPTTDFGYGPSAYLQLDCNKAGELYNISQARDSSYVGGWAIDSQGNGQFGFEIDSNPYHAAAIIQSVSYYIPNSQDVFYNNTGWFIHGSSGAWNVVYCNISVLEVSYMFSSSSNTYSVTQSSLVPVESARPVASFGMESSVIPNQIKTTVDGIGIITTGLTYEDAYGLELSRQVLARSSALYRPVDATDVSTEFAIVGSRIDLVPLAVLIASMLTLGVLTLAVLFNIVVFARVPFIRLASAYLNDPFTVVHALYGPKNPRLTWEDDALLKFGTETNGDRLSAGAMSYGGPDSEHGPMEYIFAVQKPNVVDA